MWYWGQLSVASRMLAFCAFSLLLIANVFSQDTNPVGNAGLAESSGLNLRFILDSAKSLEADSSGLAIELAVKVGKNAHELGQSEVCADAYSFAGVVSERNKDYEAAHKYYLFSLQEEMTLGRKKEEADRLLDIGIVHNSLGNFQKALDYYFRSADIRKSLGLSELLGVSYFNCGQIYSKIGEYEEARVHFQYADSCFLVSRSHGRHIRAKIGIANVRVEEGDYEGAVAEFEAISKEYEADSNLVGTAMIQSNLGGAYSMMEKYAVALCCFRKTQSLMESFEPSVPVLAALLNNQGEAYYNLPKPDSAKHFLRQAINITENGEAQIYRMKAFWNLGDVFKTEGSTDSAYFFYEEGVKIARQFGFKREEKDILSDAMKLAATSSNQQKFMNYFERWNAVADSFLVYSRFEKRRTEKLKQEALLFESKFYEAQAKALLAEAEQEKQTWYLISISVISFLVIALLSFLLFLYRQKTITQRKQHALEVEHSQKIIDTIVNERKKISEDLHTDIGGILLQIYFWIQQTRNSWSGTEGDFQDAIAKVQEFSKDVGRKVRMYSHDLDSTILITDGLVAAWKQKAREINQVTILVRAENGFPRFQPELEFRLFRITQEFINNTIKHAEAESIEINASIQEDSLLLVLKDDGKGIDQIEIDELESSGLGLRHIRQTVKALSGVVTVSNEGGTTFEIVIPLEQENGIQNYHSR